MGKSLNGKELGKGITQRKDGTYQGRFTNRFGKRQTVYGKTLTEVSKKLREEQYNDEKQINIVDSSMTLDAWFNEWLTVYKVNCRNTTKRLHHTRYNRIKDSLGWRKLSSLNLVIIQKVFNEMATDSMRKKTKALLVDMLNCAVKSDLLTKNPALDIVTQINNEPKKEKRILSDEEIQIVLEYSKDSYLHDIIVVALGTGMRIGEIIGLTWDCVDFDNNRIQVNKTFICTSDGEKHICEFHPPKTIAGNRFIYMIPSVKAVLLKLKEQRNYITPSNKLPEEMKDLVFLNGNNNHLTAANVREALYYLIKRINKKNPGMNFEPFSAHCLRHTFATKAIAYGMNPKTLQKILGHSTLQMTMDLYCHVENDTMQKEMSLMDKVV